MTPSPAKLTTALILALALAGCGPSGGPGGETVATVQGQKITKAALDSELGDGAFAGPGDRAAGEQKALERIIDRTLMAAKARKDGLDKAPDFQIRLDRARDSLLAASAQRAALKGLAPPSRSEVEAYVTAHPEAFAQRKVFIIDELRTPRPQQILKPPAQPPRSIDDVAANLAAQGVGHQRNLILFDTLTADPRITARLNGLAGGSLFQTEQEGLVLVSQIVQARSLPLTGDAALTAASQLLADRKRSEAVSRMLADLRRESPPAYAAGRKPPGN